MEQKFVTLKEIAQIVGVHRSTVDKVIHNRPGVSDEVRKKILNTLEIMGYKPNVIGKALKNQENRKTIAAVSPHVYSETYLCKGIQQGVDEFGVFGYDIEYYQFNIGDIDNQVNTLYALASRKIDGVILQALKNKQVLEAARYLIACKIPLILLNMDHHDIDALCYIGQDATIAGHTAARLTKELLNGCGNVAVINGSVFSIPSINERSTTYIDYLAAIAPNITVSAVINSNEDEKNLFVETLQLLKNFNIDCIYATSAGTKGIARAIKVAGMEGKTFIICHDLYPEIVEMLHSGIVMVTLGQALERQGYLAFKYMVDYLFFGIQPPSQKVYIDVDVRFKENAPVQ